MKKRRRNVPYQLQYVDMIASAVKKWRALSRNDKILVAQLANDNNLIMLIPAPYLDEIGFRGNPFDEEDFDLRSEMESGYVISERGQGYSVSFEGRHWRDFKIFDDALYFIISRMEERQYWPNVFSVNDHGNVSLLSIRQRKRGGPSVKVIQSWV
jgi:hypothetical protein